MPATFEKDPSAKLDYKFDFAALTNGSGDSDWLASGETISSYELDPATGITVDSDDLTDSNTSVTIWVSGGDAGKSYTVTCKIVTSAGREDERTMTFRVKNR
jgi:hypothetical protein